MENFIAQMLRRLENGEISRRQLVSSVTMVATALGTGSAAAFAQATAAAGAQVPAPPPPKTPAQDAKSKELLAARKVAPAKALQVNYIRYTCADYKVSRDFYQEVMGMHIVPGSDSGSQVKMAFYPKGVTPIGQPNGIPSPYILMRNGFVATPAPPAVAEGAPAPTLPKRVNPSHIAYTVELDKPLANGSPVWGRDTEMIRNPDKTIKMDEKGNPIPNMAGPFQTVKKILSDRGLNPSKDQETSFHIKDPQGYDLQISGVGMNGYEG
jgi:catechol 2,3-dioxygenase-like lactoylglutathione lyase family enzyme